MNCLCVENKLALGCYGLNESISVNYTPNQSGQHLLEYMFLGNTHKYPFNGASGINLVLPSVFNESRENCFQIRQPDGALFEIVSGGTTYDTFSIYNHTGDWHFPEVEGAESLENNAFQEYVDGFTGTVYIPTANSGVLPDSLERIQVYRNGQRLYNDHVLIGDSIVFNYAIINANMLYDIVEFKRTQVFFNGWNSTLLPIPGLSAVINDISVYHNGVLQYNSTVPTRDWELHTNVGIILNYTPVDANIMVEYYEPQDDCERTTDVVRDFFDSHSSSVLALSNNVTANNNIRVYHNGIREYESSFLFPRGYSLDAVNDEVNLTFTPVMADIMVEYEI